MLFQPVSYRDGASSSMLDCGCGEVPSYWAEVSADTSVLLVHIGMQPMIRRYTNGQLLVDATGVPACRAVLISPSAQFTDQGDGEILAHALIEQELGASLFDATGFVGFTVFELR